MRVTPLAGRTLAVCVLAGSMACSIDRQPTGIEFTPSLSLAKPDVDVQFGTSGDDAVYGVAVSKLGVALVGTTTGDLGGQGNAGGRDAFVRLTDKKGNPIWTKQIGTAADDGVYGVAIDRRGVYVSGTTSGDLDGFSSLGASDGFVRMLDVNGNVVWSTRLASAGADSVFGVALDGDALYVTGESRGPLWGTTVGDADGYVVKLDAQTGLIQWMTRFAGATGGGDGARAVVASGNAVFVAATYDGGFLGGGPGGQDAYLAKIDATTGAFIWFTTIASAQTDVGMDVAVAGGSAYLLGTTGDDSFAAKMDATTGQIQWKTTLATAGTDVATATDANLTTLHVGGWTTGAFPNTNNAGAVDVFHATLDAQTGQILGVDQVGTPGVDASFGSLLEGKSWFLVGTTGGDLAGTSSGGLDALWLQFADR